MREKLLRDLRILYREGKFIELRKKYLLGAFLLTPEDRKKIEEVTGIMVPNKPGTQMELDDIPPLMKKAQEIFGGKITQI